ncbi:hypothetical protein [Natrialba sp. INN-245]|uniref:hypothetical protein n=1 Tax=Natrialba sp. INN-245 TaxID=2690967 RepID=UPI001312A1C1|nr:hypothetical protein [Natrialba sp. INN-245]MWV39234.1 hypothetical protein [Natrialba sp. INN-245]
MARQLRAVVVTLAVRVPVNATGSLADGATRVVERIDAVSHLEDVEVRGVQPGLNDTVVELHVRADLTFDDEGADDALVRRELEGGVGVRRVDEVETVDAERTPVAEVG